MNGAAGTAQGQGERLARLEDVAERIFTLLPGAEIPLVNPLIYANLTDAAGDAFRHALLTTHAARYFAQPEVALYRYPPGTVVDGGPVEFYLTLAGLCLVRQQWPGWAENPAAHAARLEAAARAAPVVQAPCLLVARYGDVTWGHWLCEMLPKIVLAEQAEPQRFTYVVPYRTTTPGGPVPDAYVRAVLDSLAAYGIAPHRLLRIPPGRALAFSALFDLSGMFPLAGEDFFSLHPRAMALMAARVRPAQPRPDLPRRPFLLRGGADLRRLDNAPDILTRLARHGFTPVDIAALPYAEQARLFGEAPIIAGELGSGFAGAIHAPPDARYLALAPSGWNDFYFTMQFQKTRALLADIRGASAGEPARAAYRVPPADVDAGLEALMASSAARPHNEVGGEVFPRAPGVTLLTMKFGTRGNAGAYVAAGFSDAEAEHTWSIGAACELNVARTMLGAARDVWLEACGFCFAPSSAKPLKPLRLIVNGVDAGTRFAVGHSRPVWRMPARALAGQGVVRLRFEHPDCPSPAALGMSADTRPLGYGFITVRLFSLPPAAAGRAPTR